MVIEPLAEKLQLYTEYDSPSEFNINVKSLSLAALAFTVKSPLMSISVSPTAAEPKMIAIARKSERLLFNTFFIYILLKLYYNNIAN
jgi:hypothetical protein